MNRRRNNILQDIVNKFYKTIEEYCIDFEVSEQTIRNDIRDINETLKLKHQPVIRIDDSGKLFIDNHLDIDEAVITNLANESDFNSYKLSPNERKTILAVTLLNADDYITIARLTEVVFMSRNTLLNDLDELKAWFDENGMHLVSQKRKGFTVVGSESCIRNGMLRLLMLNGEMFGHDNNHENENHENDIFRTLLLQKIDHYEVLNIVEKILNTAEYEHGVHLTDFSYRELVYYLLIAVNRLIKKKALPESNKVNWMKMKQSSKYNISCEILNNLKKSFSFTISSQEIVQLIETLRSKSYIKNNGKSIDMIDIQILINEFIYKMSANLQINYYLDFYLYDMLIDHMRTAVHRLRQKHSIVNPLMPQLKEMYPNVFVEVKEHIKSLEEYVKLTFSEDEISFIVMYFVSVMEKNKDRDVIINTIVVCNSGRGTAQLISAKLQSLSKQINVVDIISSHNMRIINDKCPDMIISTVPLKEENIPYILVSPILTDDDLYQIQKLAFQIQDKKQKVKPLNQIKVTSEDSIVVPFDVESIFKSQTTFLGMLSKNRIKLGVNAKDWKEAVRAAGEILYDDKKIEKSYIDAMIENIKINGPYVAIFPGIAIPHATATDGVIEVAASMIRLNKPVCFHHELNDPIKYVVALSVLDSDYIDRPLYNLTMMLGTNTFLDEIDKAETATEILEIISKYEEMKET